MVVRKRAPCSLLREEEKEQGVGTMERGIKASSGEGLEVQSAAAKGASGVTLM
jgi:hypothetical protein